MNSIKPALLRSKLWLVLGLCCWIWGKNELKAQDQDYFKFIERALVMRDYREAVSEDSLQWALKEAQQAKDYPKLIEARIVMGSQCVRNDQLEKGDSIFTLAFKECEYLEGRPRILKATVLSELANIQYIRGNLDSTWTLQHMVYEVDKEFQDTFGMIVVLQNIANAAHAMGKANLAMEKLVEAIDLCREINDSHRVAPILNKIAFIYHNNTDDYRNAIKNFKEAEAAITERSEHVRLMNQLGLAEALVDSGNLEQALETAKGVIKPEMSPRENAYVSTGLSNIYIMMGDTQKAMPHLISAYEYGLENGIPYFMLDASLELGIIRYREGKYEKSREYLQKAKELVEAYEMLKIQVTVTEYLAKVALAEENTKDAINHLNNLVNLKDSFAKQQESEKLAEAQVKFETAKTERENAYLSDQTILQQEELTRKNRQIVLFLSVSTILLVSFLLIMRQRQALKRINQQLTDQNTLIAQQTEELKALDKQKNIFFANVSHELRTPLTLVLGPLEKMLSGNENLSRSTSGNLNLAYQGTLRLRELVEEVLDVTRLNNDKLKLNLKAENFYPFIHRVQNAFESMAELKSQILTLDYKCSTDLAISVDRDKIEKIISNLVSNAFKFSPEETEIVMTVSNEGSTYKIEVKDQGPGLKSNELTKVFERNYQTSDGLHGGLGIGLWLSRELARLMHGDMVAVNNEDDGATFEFTFQAKETKAPEKDAPTLLEDEIELPKLDIDRKAHVLVVEDNHEMREFIMDTLKPYFLIYNAANGNEALEVLKTRKIDLITSDVMMAELGGFELLAQVRENTDWNHIPFVMITARSDEDSRIYALKEGVDDYVIKPFLARELIVRVHNILKNYLLRRQQQEVEELKTVDEQDSDILERTIEEHLTDEKLSAEMLAEITAMSERTVYRQIKSIFGMSPAQFIREKRLSKARKILEGEHRRTVSEVAFEVGYRNTKTFSKHFSERFGKYPSEYLR